jgi:hypothetical protein
MFQAKQIRFLTEAVWKGVSVVSGKGLNDPNDPLVFCKWRREESWSPWNTALFTAEEAQVHEDAAEGGIPLAEVIS